MLACVVTGAVAYLVFEASPHKIIVDVNAEKPASKDFDVSYCNTVVVDTFIQLVQKAYPSFATISKQHNNVQVSIQGAGALTQDFYNGNDNLLKLKIDDYGFEIKYNPNTKSIIANFKLENNGVTVPNDVLLRLASKTYKLPTAK